MRAAVLLVACQPLPPASIEKASAGTTGTTSSTVTVTSQSGSESSESTSTVGFIQVPDSAGNIECDIWSNDCPDGEKCVPYGKGECVWNATKCVPIARDAKGLYETCTVEESEWSGVDDCGEGYLCWAVDPDTLIGRCFGLCIGTEAEAECEDPCATCPISGENGLILCLPSCDPVEQTCPDNEACYPVLEDFGCAPDASGDAGGYGEACEFNNACDPGLGCMSASLVPGCVNAQSCCAPFCDLLDPVCPDVGVGVECIPWYEDGQEPDSCFDFTVGICGLPQ